MNEIKLCDIQVLEHMRNLIMLGIDIAIETNTTESHESYLAFSQPIYFFPCQLYTSLTFSASPPFVTTTLLV
jgi:hypothetical protein